MLPLLIEPLYVTVMQRATDCPPSMPPVFEAVENIAAPASSSVNVTVPVSHPLVPTVLAVNAADDTRLTDPKTTTADRTTATVAATLRRARGLRSKVTINGALIFWSTTSVGRSSRQGQRCVIVS